MKAFLSTHIMVSFHLLIVAITITAAAALAEYQQAHVLDSLDAYAVEQTQQLRSLAATMSWNGADGPITEIIADCEQRSDFDVLIGNLGRLPKSDLLRAQQLMQSCGKYAAVKASLMANRFRETLHTLESVIVLREKINDTDPARINIAPWTRLADLEELKSAYLREQYDIQMEIIRILLVGGPSGDLRELSGRAQEIAELLTVNNTELQNARTTLDI